MNNSSLRRLLPCALSLAAGWLLIAPTRAAEPDGSAKQAAPAAKSAGSEQAKDGGDKPDNPLHLAAEQRKAAGIVLAKPAAIMLSPEVDAYGRVIDPAPLVALLAEHETARAALTASEKELTRVKTLFQNGANASAQAVETAEANVGRDRAAADSAHLRLVAGWGAAVSDPKRLDELRSALAGGAVLARLDVLPGDEPASHIGTVSVRRVSGGASINADIIGASTVADPQIQGPGFLVLIREGSFPVGAALRATLPGSGEGHPAYVVPRSAIVYHEGSAWVYVLGEKDTFTRQLVTIARSVENGVALRGIEADDQVVTAGAEELLAAELRISAAGGGERD